MVQPHTSSRWHQHSRWYVACRATHPGLRNQRASCSMRRRPAAAAAAPQKIDSPPRLRRSRLDAVPRASALGMVPSMAGWRCRNQPDQAGSRLGRRRIALRRRKLRQGVSGSTDLEQPCILGEEREHGRGDWGPGYRGWGSRGCSHFHDLVGVRSLCCGPVYCMDPIGWRETPES
jgi:hypothetical protein